MNNRDKQYRNSKKTYFILAVLLGCGQVGYAMDEMTDEELSRSTAQGEFLTIKNISANPSDPNGYGNPNPNVGFTRLTLNSKVEINSNIDKLRLGCDNANYTNCDISIDKLVLTGLVEPKRVDNKANNFPNFGNVVEKLNSTKKLTSKFYTPKDAGPATDFVMDNPFIELAIQNPDSLVNRKMVGFRFGAHEVWGMMSTGQAPQNADGSAKDTVIYGPKDWDSRDTDPANYVRYGTGEKALDDLWSAINIRSFLNYPDQPERFARLMDYINYSVEKEHTGVNSISGRLPLLLDNLNIEARVYRAVYPLIPDTHAQTAVVSGSLSRDNMAQKKQFSWIPDTESDFGKDDKDPLVLGSTFGTDYEQYSKGYLRNVYLGDSDTNYDVATYGKYVANDTRVGRAPTLKRASRALLENMIVNVHKTTADIGAGDRPNTQDIATKTFHQLQYGLDVNKNGKYDKGEGAKHMAFQYQTLDGLQWITTNTRFGTKYDKLGNVVAGNEKPVNGGGYDWLSTRAGWWLESPMSRVMNAYVSKGQTVSYGIPKATVPIQLKSLDLGPRPVDNCYGNLSFC